jgi:hypothetical protein
MARAARSTVNTANPFETTKQARRLDGAAGCGYDGYSFTGKIGRSGKARKTATNLAGEDCVGSVGGAEPPERPALRK